MVGAGWGGGPTPGVYASGSCARARAAAEGDGVRSTRASSSPAVKYSTQDCAATAWSVALLFYANEPLLPAIAFSLCCMAAELPAQHIKCNAWAESALKFMDLPLLAAISAAAIPRRPPLDDHGRAAFAWAEAPLVCRSFPLLHAISACAMPKCVRLGAMPIACLAWSFAALPFKHALLSNSLSAAAIHRMLLYAPQRLAMTSWSMAIMRGRLQPVFGASRVCSVLGERDCDWDARHLANTAWAASALCLGNAGLLNAISAPAVRTPPDNSAQHRTNTVWSIAPISFVDSTRLKSLGRRPAVVAGWHRPPAGASPLRMN
eukprot:NODE_14336_length_1115_cov_1.577935.p1 GENE.NODE_14336_length_1115_cov_1.577935~~NODE_14336_length_1115_cov_1.577935.p1  ORF type:complete len:353 (+),score=15.23 NODE_14336_length_1115_cov_1.577935:105-1061(+)